MHPQIFSLPEATLLLWEEFFLKPKADDLFTELLNQTPWQTKMIQRYGKSSPLPRQTAWYGDPNARYRYSGIVNEPLPWTPTLTAVRDKVQRCTGYSFNSVLLNLYRSGSDSVSWHADNEPELGGNPAIASINLGEVRVFQLRHTTRKDVRRVDIPLPHGSLLLMKDGAQIYWQHQIPKTSRSIGARINLTFRDITGRP